MNLLKMKTSTRSRWSALLLSLVISTGVAQAASVSIDSFDGQRAVVSGQGFTRPNKPSFQVNFYVNGSFKSDTNTDSSGNFKQTVNATSGSTILVKVLNFNGNGNHAEHTLRVQGRTTPQPTKPTPTPTATLIPAPAPQPTPTLPVGFRMSERELRDYANSQARTVANRVANTYGKLENWKYNFMIGYWLGYDAMNSYNAVSLESDGRQAGRIKGRDAGYAAGYNYAIDAASAQGQAEAAARFRAIVNTNASPNTNVPNITVPAFGGLRSDGNACNSEATAIPALESKLASEMRLVEFGTIDTGYLSYDATAYSIRFYDLQKWGRGTYHFVESYFRADYAWSEWINNDLAGKYKKADYRRLADDQRTEFRRIFGETYNDVIDEKFTRQKTQQNLFALSRGQFYGIEIGKSQAYDRGCKVGYAERYSAASINGYNASYAASFKSKFNSTVQYYNSNPVVSLDGLRLVDENRNGIFELGENVGIIVGKVTNLGRVAARGLDVRMSGEGLDSLANAESVTIPPSTSQMSGQVINGLARVRSDVIADKNNVVRVSIGETSQSLAFSISWKSTILALANADSSTAATLKQFVLQNILNEYTTNEAAANNIYKESEKTPSKLRDLVELYETLPEHQRETIRSMGPTIVNMKEKAQNNKWSTGRLRKDFEAMALRIK